jgi:hypothetical protein
MSRAIRFLLLGVAGLSAVALSSCDSGPSQKAANATTATSILNPNFTATTGAKTVPYSPTRNARADVTTGAICSKGQSNAWVLDGHVNNPSHQIQTFTIVVDFVDQPGNTVLDTQIVHVPSVEPNKNVAWSATWKDAGAALACIVRQVQAS